MHQTQPSLFGRVGALLAGLALSGAVALSATAATPAATPATSTAPAEPAARPQVEIKTTMGDIVVELDREKAPKSVDNFLAYVKSGFYKGTIFHRVIDGFMIQGGGYDEKLKQKPPRKNIPSESQNGLSNDAYTIAMARMDDPNSANAQFFINVADNQGLNFPGRDGVGYTVFGKVIDGRETVDKIKGVLVDDKGMFQNIPVTPILVKSATILKTPIQPKL